MMQNGIRDTGYGIRLGIPFWGGASGVLRLRVGRATVRAEAVRRDVVTWAGETMYASAGDLTEVVARLAGEAQGGCRHLVVEIEKPAVQLRTLVDLPPVKTRALGDLVAHQQGRFFRRNGHALVTDAAWISNNGARVARAAAVAETLVEALVSGAKAAGLELDRIAPADADGRLSLLPPTERAARRRAALLGLRRLALIASALWLGVGILYGGRVMLERRAVERELATVAEPVEAILAARRELREAEAMVATLADAEQTRGRTVALLASLASALPDSTVLTSLTLDARGGGRMTGAARRAAEVVAKLEGAQGIAAPTLEGPVVLEAIGGREWERFTIRFKRDTGYGIRDTRRP